MFIQLKSYTDLLQVITWKASQDIYYKQYGSFSRDAERIEYFLRMVLGPVLVKLSHFIHDCVSLGDMWVYS